MLRNSLGAALILAASVVAASGGQPLPRRAAAPARSTPDAVRTSPAGTREFQFRGLVFTIPASWSVERAGSQPPRMQYVTVAGTPSGPRLTFSDTVELVSHAGLPRGPMNTIQQRQRLSFERFEMPNPMMRSVVYVFPAAGITISARVRTEAEVRAADAVAQSARWALPNRGPARS